MQNGAGTLRSLRTVSYIGVEGERTRAFKKGGYGERFRHVGPLAGQSFGPYEGPSSAAQAWSGGVSSPYPPNIKGRSIIPRIPRGPSLAPRRFPWSFVIWAAGQALNDYYGYPTDGLDTPFNMKASTCNTTSPNNCNTNPTSLLVPPCQGSVAAWSSLCSLPVGQHPSAYPKASVEQTKFWNFVRNPPDQPGYWVARGIVRYVLNNGPRVSVGLIDVGQGAYELPAVNPMAWPEAMPIGGRFQNTRPISTRRLWTRVRSGYPQGDDWGYQAPGETGGTPSPPGSGVSTGSVPPGVVEPPPHVKEPPGPGVKEKKFSTAFRGVLPVLMDVSGETMEFVDCAFNALGGKEKAIAEGYGTGEYGTFVSPQARAAYVYRHWQDMRPEDFVSFVGCVAANQLEDKAIGWLQKQKARGLLDAFEKYGYNVPYFLTSKWAIPKV